MKLDLNFTLSSLRNSYEIGNVTPEIIINEVFNRIENDSHDAIWISLRDKTKLFEIVSSLKYIHSKSLPLYGIPFSVKDNIDVEGLPTTAACPSFSYTAKKSATIVEQLEKAGAICIGKTNMDQFATGLNGTRSPYGSCGSAFNPMMVAGGSSSGSAVSVALQQVCFSLGTDTGGSGRIPAGLNNIVGLKPTVGILSSNGLVPCCPSLDCPSIFSLNVEDAIEVAEILFQTNSSDPSLRYDYKKSSFNLTKIKNSFNVYIPQKNQLEFFGNEEGKTLYENAIVNLCSLGGVIKYIDYEPFLEASKLLFDGPWVADRYASIGSFIQQNKDNVLDVTKEVVDNGIKWKAEDVFKAMEKIKDIKAFIRSNIEENDFLVLPTVPTIYTIKEMEKDPILLNNQHGYYSYFANILDLCAISIPSNFYSIGMPFGITIMAHAFKDSQVASLGKAFTDLIATAPGKERDS